MTPSRITPIEFNRYCENCEEERCFVAEFDCLLGLIAQCPGCEEIVIVRWTHTPSDMAWEVAT